MDKIEQYKKLIREWVLLTQTSVEEIDVNDLLPARSFSYEDRKAFCLAKDRIIETNNNI